MGQLEIPMIWRRAPIVAMPKSENLLRDPEGYSSLCLWWVKGWRGRGKTEKLKRRALS